MTYRFYEHFDLLHGDADFDSKTGMLDFWKWAFSDLLEDTLKGLYAEWLVGHLLGLPMKRGDRFHYGNFDLRSSGGLRIEVKSSSYWQSWKLRNPDGSPRSTDEVDSWRPTDKKRIVFGGLRAKDAVDRTNVTIGYKSDVYVFAFQSETDPLVWDALDLSQWEFYFLSRADLDKVGVKSLSLKRLRSMCSPLTARMLQQVGRSRLAELELTAVALRDQVGLI